MCLCVVFISLKCGVTSPLCKYRIKFIALQKNFDKTGWPFLLANNKKSHFLCYGWKERKIQNSSSSIPLESEKRTIFILAPQSKFNSSELISSGECLNNHPTFVLWKFIVEQTKCMFSVFSFLGQTQLICVVKGQ